MNNKTNNPKTAGQVALGYQVFNAIEQNDKDMLDYLLNHAPDLGVVKKCKESVGEQTFGEHTVRPLEFAIMKENQELALALIQAGAPLHDNEIYEDLEHRERYGHPFLLASKKCQWSVAEAVLSRLDPDDKKDILMERLFLAVLAENPDEVENLVRLGADPNSFSEELRVTPLFHACALGSTVMIDCLVACGASWDWEDKKGQKPKDYIISNYPHLKSRYGLEDEKVVKMSTRMS